MIDNILSDPTNNKLRKIKVSNPAFWKRAGQWNGCIDFLLSCGFRSVGVKNGVPSHLKHEGQGELLICGREELVRFAVENLGLQNNFHPVCPLKTECCEGEINAASKCNSIEAPSLPVESTRKDLDQDALKETLSIEKSRHHADSVSNDSLSTRATKTKSITKSCSASSKSIKCSLVSLEVSTLVDHDVDSETAVAEVPEIKSLTTHFDDRMGDIDFDTTMKEPIQPNNILRDAKTGVPGSITEKNEYLSLDCAGLECSTKTDATNSHVCKSNDEAVTEEDINGSIPTMRSKDKATAPELPQSLIEETSDLHSAFSENKRNHKPDSNAIGFSADHHIKIPLTHAQVTTQEEPSVAVPDDMADLLKEIENELDGYSNTDLPIRAKEINTDLAPLNEAKDTIFSHSSAETKLDTDDNTKPSVKTKNTLNNGDDSDHDSCHDLDSPILKPEITPLKLDRSDEIIVPVDTKIMSHDNGQDVMTTSLAEKVNADSELDYQRIITGFYLTDSDQMPQMNTDDRKEDTSSDSTGNSKSTNVVIEKNKINPPTHKLPTPEISTELKPNEKQPLSDDSETVLSIHNVPLVDQFTNKQVEQLSIDDSAMEHEVSTSSSVTANAIAKSTSNDNRIYQSSVRDIPLPECISLGQEEIKLFQLGFELCHHMLISLWYIEGSLQKASQTSIKPTNITTGLSNVKAWTIFSNEDDLNLHTEDDSKGDDRHCTESKPALIVPLAFVYKAWVHLLEKNTTTRSRAIYSRIVSNHPNLATLDGIPVGTSLLFSNFSETDMLICNYVCNSLRNCGLITVYGADVIAFSDHLSSELSFFVGIGQTVCDRFLKNHKSLWLDESFLNECHEISANAAISQFDQLLKKEDFSLDESTLLWHSCRYLIHHLLSCGRIVNAEKLLLDKKFAAARLKSMGFLRAVYTLCWDCASMTTLHARLITQQQLAGDVSPNETIPDIRHSCITSICIMSEMLQKNVSNNNSIDINNRCIKAELGTCFQLLGESIGNAHNVTDAIKQFEEALSYRTEVFGESQNHESIADTLCAYYMPHECVNISCL